MVAVPALIAGHGDEGAVLAVDDLDAPDGETAVQGDRGVGQHAAAGAQAVDLHLHLHGGRLPGGGALGCGFALGFAAHDLFLLNFSYGQAAPECGEPTSGTPSGRPPAEQRSRLPLLRPHGIW